MTVVRQAGSGVTLQVSVQPRASREEVVGIHDDRLRVRLTAPPVDNAANTSLVRLLAKKVGVRRSQVSVTAGLRNRHKTVFIEGATLKDVQETLGL